MKLRSHWLAMTACLGLPLSAALALIASASAPATAPRVEAAANAEDQPQSADEWFETAVRAFFAADIPRSALAFDQVVALAPDSLPQLWQRGLVLYYAERFADGVKQFERHQEVNPNDVENAVWHFLCVARADGLEQAKKRLMPIRGDTRVPMAQIHQLFAGSIGVEAVLTAANQPAPSEEAQRNQLCYAHLYLGLYFEAQENMVKAREHILKAAQEFAMPHYMGRVALTHAKLHGWMKDSPSPD